MNSIHFPPFFDGLLPEGYQLEGLLKFGKFDRNDLFSQLMAIGEDMVGNTNGKGDFTMKPVSHNLRTLRNPAL